MGRLRLSLGLSLRLSRLWCGCRRITGWLRILGVDHLRNRLTVLLVDLFQFLLDIGWGDLWQAGLRLHGLLRLLLLQQQQLLLLLQE